MSKQKKKPVKPKEKEPKEIIIDEEENFIKTSTWLMLLLLMFLSFTLGGAMLLTSVNVWFYQEWNIELKIYWFIALALIGIALIGYCFQSIMLGITIISEKNYEKLSSNFKNLLPTLIALVAIGFSFFTFFNK